MGQLNLYKMNKTMIDDFEVELNKKYESLGNEKEISLVKNGKQKRISLELYVDRPDVENYVEWNWLTRLFEDSDTTTRSNPKGILIIRMSSEYYACTYGYSFMLVDKYCDTEFAFEFARRIEYSEIKTTTLLSPSSKRNKVINAYIDYRNLEFDSGESFAKLKVKAKIPEGFTLFSAALEIGHSIKFFVTDDSLMSIVQVIQHVEYTIRNRDVIYRIPLFNKVKDDEQKDDLDNRLKISLRDNVLKVNLSELEIIGVTETFVHNYTSFSLCYYTKTLNLECLDEVQILEFIKSCKLTPYEGLKKVKILSKYCGVEIDQDILYNLVDYTDDERRCVLSRGKWFYYNDDYLQYLADSISEIDVVYEPAYNFTKEVHAEFISLKYETEKNKPEYKDAEKEAVLRSLRRKYYVEYAFNLKAVDDGFICYDRQETRIRNSKIELMDLYKDETVYAVKFGDSSSKLCYAVDQSLSTLKQYKHQTVKELPITSRFGIWIHISRKTKLNMKDGKPDINELNMLMFKNKLDSWKKEVRLQGFTPIIRINYCSDQL